jgi:transposase
MQNQDVKRVKIAVSRCVRNKLDPRIKEKLDNYKFMYDEYIEKNQTVKQLATILGVTGGCVAKYLKFHGIKKATFESILSKEYLHVEYTLKGRSAFSIAKEFNTSSDTVIRYLKKYKISIRGYLEYKYPSKEVEDKLNDIGFLTENYLLEKKSLDQIAKELGVVLETVRRHLIKFGIDRRDLFHDRKDVEQKLKDKNYLYTEYYQNNKTLREMGNELGVPYITVQAYMDKFGINRLTNPQRFLKDNPNLEGRLNNQKYLYEQYVTNNKTSDEIAKELNISGKAVLNSLRKFGIEIRDQYYGREDIFKKLDDKDFLYQEYIIKRKSSTQIARELGSYDSIVGSRIRSFGIVMRKSFEYECARSSLHDFQLIPLIEKYKIIHQTSYILRKPTTGDAVFEIDEYLPDYKIFLELQGMYWHGYRKKNKTTAKHVLKDIQKNSFMKKYYPDHKIVYILESDFEDGMAEQIISQIVNPVSKKKEFWDKTQYQFSISSTFEVKKFIKQHHYIGSTPINKYVFKATKDGELVAVAVFSHPSRNEQRKKYGENVLELSRYCSNEHGTNLGSWFLGKCLRYVKERPIVTYADITRYPGKPGHDGTLYKAANFKWVGKTNLNYRYLKPDGTFLHKRSVWTRAKKNGTEERSQADKEGLYRYYEWPKYIYLYE